MGSVLKQDGSKLGMFSAPGPDDYPLTFKYDPPKDYIDVNGQMGHCLELVDEENADWKVRLDNGTDAIVNRQNLALQAGATIVESALVAMVGLDKPGLNGKIAVAVREEEGGAWLVRLSDGTEK